ncbi:hypothetical protein [Mycobacterium leprae]|nr:hypothetical protein [Mycobacterium leprae]
MVLRVVLLTEEETDGAFTVRIHCTLALLRVVNIVSDLDMVSLIFKY